MYIYINNYLVAFDLKIYLNIADSLIFSNIVISYNVNVISFLPGLLITYKNKYVSI